MKYIEIGRAYISWTSMHDRCYSKKSSSYDNYGGRGIIVCDRWHGEDGFDNFIKDMGGKPFKSYSLDRIDVNGNYEPVVDGRITSNKRITTTITSLYMVKKVLFLK